MNSEGNASKLVLIIEDDPDIREVLSSLLKLEGYNVDSVENGKAGVEYLERSPAPTLILLDLMMPVMNGWQFRTIQKMHPEWSKIPVIVLSADNKVEQKAILLESDAFMKKPVDFDLLLQMIDQFYKRD